MKRNLVELNAGVLKAKLFYISSDNSYSDFQSSWFLSTEYQCTITKGDYLALELIVD